MSDIVKPSRGGMCSNPFGGEERIDRLNLLESLGSNAVSEKVLYASIIQDAASNYLYAFLGKNGTSAEEFFSAWQYFFKVESTNAPSWNHHKTIKISFNQRGEKINQSRLLTDDELKLMCFDKHYDMSGLADHMHIDKFRSGLKKKRRTVLNNNWEQVQTFVSKLYQHELSMVADRQQVPLQVWSHDLLDILVDPPSPTHLANAIYVPNRLKRSCKARPPKLSSTQAKTKSTVMVEGQRLFVFEGAGDDQAVSNNVSDCIHSNPD